jgi:peroxiredoxin
VSPERQKSKRFSGGPQPGQLAPDFDLPTLNGSRFCLSDLRGKQPVFIQFGSIT